MDSGMVLGVERGKLGSSKRDLGLEKLRRRRVLVLAGDGEICSFSGDCLGGGSTVRTRWSFSGFRTSMIGDS